MTEKLNTYFIKTFGCTFNQSDSDKIEFILTNSDYINTPIIEDANIIIVNTCAVKLQTESKIFDFLINLRKKFTQKLIIVTGCLPQIDQMIRNKIEILIGDNGFILNPTEISLILQKITLITNPDISLVSSNIIRDKAELTPVLHPESTIGIIQISEGCNLNCTYCCTKTARGSLISFNPIHILKQIEYYLTNGKKEIYLTSQDLGIYDYNGIKLHDLIKMILNLKYDFKIRLGMMNPTYLNKYFKNFLILFENQKLYRFLHLPIQSGSQEILKRMGRYLDFNLFYEIIKEIREFDPKFSFSTDIIVGFPTENNDHFNSTIDFIEKWKPDVINISKYTNRPNTIAKKMPQVRSQIIKQRSKILSTIYQDYMIKNNESWIGWEGEILINEKNSNAKYPFTGRNLYYKPIIITDGVIGEIKKCKIKSIIQNSLIGESYNINEIKQV